MSFITTVPIHVTQPGSEEQWDALVVVSVCVINMHHVQQAAGSHLREAVFGEHVKQRSLPALAVPHHHYLTLHTLTGIHAGFQR